MNAYKKADMYYTKNRRKWEKGWNILKNAETKKKKKEKKSVPQKSYFKTAKINNFLH